MRKLAIATLLSLVTALPAMANWTVKPDGSAMIETDGSSSLTLRCDNNANTGNRPGWNLRLDALDLRTLGTSTRVDFRFPGYRPLSLRADNRMGFVSLESMNMPTQSDLETLVHRLKAASRVTVTVVDNTSGNALEPLAFNLRGSSKAIGSVARSCR